LNRVGFWFYGHFFLSQAKALGSVHWDLIKVNSIQIPATAAAAAAAAAAAEAVGGAGRERGGRGFFHGRPFCFNVTFGVYIFGFNLVEVSFN